MLITANVTRNGGGCKLAVIVVKLCYNVLNIGDVAALALVYGITVMLAGRSKGNVGDFKVVEAATAFHLLSLLISYRVV